jgi:hypothetical protein
MNSPDTYDPPESIAAPPTITVTRDTDTLYRNLAPGEVVTVRNESGRSVDLRLASHDLDAIGGLLVERDGLRAEVERLKGEVAAVLDWAVNFGSSLEWHTVETDDGPRFGGCSAMGPVRREYADTPIAAIRKAAGIDPEPQEQAPDA